MRDTLDTLGLTDTFGAIVTADDVYRGRPDPEAYLLAAQQLGRPPVRCVVIGEPSLSRTSARRATLDESVSRIVHDRVSALMCQGLQTTACQH